MDLALPDSHRLETLQLLRRAIDNGWDIPDVVMQAAPRVCADMILHGTARDKLRAMDLLIRMRDSNIAVIQTTDKIERLDGGTPTEIYTLGKIEL